MDFVKDQNPKPLYKFFDSMPEYVKSASLVTEEETEKLASAAFADPIRREFPCHTKVATWNSAAYYAGSGMNNESIRNRIVKAAETHGIKEDVEAVLAKTFTKYASDKTDSSVSEFALIVDFGDGDVKGFYKCGSAEDIVEACLQLTADIKDQRIPAEYMRDAATNIVKAAKQFDCLEDLPQQIKNLGTPKLLDFDHAASVLRLRKNAGVDEEGVELYQEIVKAASEDPDNVENYIALCNDLDRMHSVRYSSMQPTPAEAFYSGPLVDDIIKMANENVIVGSVMVPVSAFESLPDEELKKHFNKEAAEILIGIKDLATKSAAYASEMFEKLNMSSAGERKLLGLLIKHSA
jgi:hypothetical protein